MKNINILKSMVAILLLTLSATSAFAKTSAEQQMTEEDWAQLFATEISKNQSNLGAQCMYKSDAEYKDSKKKQILDEDLKITNKEFIKQLESVGLPASSYNIDQYYETKDICYLTQNEFLAIQLYTGSYYSVINSALRELNLEKIKNYRLLIKFLVAGLSKLENYVGVTKRGTNLNPMTISSCKVGAAFADRGFLSTSIAAGFSAKYRFILASRSCKYIAPFSRIMHEEEVLCLPGTVFQIRYMNKSDTGTQVILQEAGQQFDVDQLVESLEDHPEYQNPSFDSDLAQTCQPENVVFDKDKETNAEQ